MPLHSTQTVQHSLTRLIYRPLSPSLHSTTMGESASATLRHKTLSAYYPALTTLGAHLSTFPSLLYHSDPDQYRSLLETTVCAPNDKAGSAPPLGPAEWTQQEAIDRILQELVSVRGQRGDVLTFGTKVCFVSVSAKLTLSHGARVDTTTRLAPAWRLSSRKRQAQSSGVGHGRFLGLGELPRSDKLTRQYWRRRVPAPPPRHLLVPAARK